MTSRTTERRPLNAFDVAMLGVNEVLQRGGNAGFETLAVIWLEKRIEVPALQAAIAKLTAKFPVLAAKLVRDWKGKFFWQWEPESQCPFHERKLDDSTWDAVSEVASAILSRRRNLKRESPVDFHLLHLPDGSDVLLMHSNHVLLDHASATLVLQELNRLFGAADHEPPATHRDLIDEYRSRFPFRARFRAFRKALRDLLQRKKSLPLRLVEKTSDRPGSAELRILTRELNAEQTARLQQYIRTATRLPSASMTILGAAFSALSEMVANPESDDRYRTGIGVELPGQNPKDPLPQNLSSVLRLQITHEELQDPIRRIEVLNERLHEMLKNRRDVGMVEASSLFTWNFPLIRLVSKYLMTQAFSLWYAYFSVPPDLADSFGGVPIRQTTHIGPAWSPLGVTLLVTQFRDRLALQLTYVPQLVSAQRAQEFLNGVVGELCNLSGE